MAEQEDVFVLHMFVTEMHAQKNSQAHKSSQEPTYPTFTGPCALALPLPLVIVNRKGFH